MCLTYTLPLHMKSPIRSSFYLIEGRFPRAQSNFVIFRTKLFVGRFLCTK
jgi:hypothetical protein